MLFQNDEVPKVFLEKKLLLQSVQVQHQDLTFYNLSLILILQAILDLDLLVLLEKK